MRLTSSPGGSDEWLDRRRDRRRLIVVQHVARIGDRQEDALRYVRKPLPDRGKVIGARRRLDWSQERD